MSSTRSWSPRRGRLAAACLALVACAPAPPVPGVVATTTSPTTASTSPGSPPGAVVSATASPAQAPPSSVPEPRAPPPALVLERHACRAIAPAYRLSVAADGAIGFVGERNVGVRRAQAHVEPAAVRDVVDRALAAGIERWGHTSCEPTDGSRCSMHPCRTSIAVTRDGVTHVASRADDVRHPSAAFAAVVADVERLARTWRWVDPAVEPGAASPCASAQDCTLRKDRCGQLHATRLGDTSPLEVATCAPGWPTSRVEPVCVESRCLMAPVVAR